MEEKSKLSATLCPWRLLLCTVSGINADTWGTISIEQSAAPRGINCFGVGGNILFGRACQLQEKRIVRSTENVVGKGNFFPWPHLQGQTFTGGSIKKRQIQYFLLYPISRAPNGFEDLLCIPLPIHMIPIHWVSANWAPGLPYHWILC